ncbi:MAG: nucleoside hydrolase [Acidobacteriota bacterium]|nr:nucleoside hydrolase [Acidobacteriota bacterium]
MRRAKFWLAVFVAAASCHAQQRIPIIFDTDIGDDIDDALALALALQSPELDVRAVTTVIDDPDTRARLAWKELGLYGRHDVQLGIGASDPLLSPPRKAIAAQFQELTSADSLPANVHRRAADLIIDTLMQSPAKITIVPVGPLTNIALALKLDPRIKDKIERIVLMGGAFDLLRPEYNIVRDSAAAEIVFASGVPITAVGLDVTLKCKLEGKDLERLRAAQNPASRFLVRLIELWQTTNPGRFPTLHDPLAVAVAFRPNLVETQQGRVQVEVSSGAANGLTIFTPSDKVEAKTPPATLVSRQVNARAFLDMFIERLSQSPRARQN